MLKNFPIHRAGYLAGLTAFTATVAYCIVQLMQINRVFHFPVDEILIYGTSLCIVIPFVLELLAFHYITPGEKKFWSHAAVLFAMMYAVFVTANYVVQLATVIPARLYGSANEIRLLEQTPHSLFWDFDALGYIFMGLATFIAIPALEKNGFDRWVRISFIANTLTIPLISIVYFFPVYSERLLMLGSPWVITAPLSMLMLAIMIKRKSMNLEYSITTREKRA